MEREPVKISQLLTGDAAEIFATMRNEAEKQVLEGALNAERSVILNVAQQVFNRDPTPEELTLFRVIEQPGMVDRYQLAFKEVIIGWVIRKLDGFNLKIEFHPDPEFPIV